MGGFFSKPQPPHNYKAILEDADSPPDMSSLEKLYDELYHGVFLRQKKQKYWVDKKSKRNCFMLFARDLSISWADKIQHWSWLPSDEISSVEVAKLKKVCWLEVTGKFKTENLSPNTLYEVAFVVKLIDPTEGWEVPVNLRLVPPTGEMQERQENMQLQPRHRWIEIPAGKFRTSPEITGEIEFSMYEQKSGTWKTGLLIKGVVIQPKI